MVVKNIKYCKCGCGNIVQKNYKKGHGRRGRKNTPEHNKAISEYNKNRILTEEQKNRLRSYNINRKHTEETKQKMSKIAKEKKFGKWMIGKKLSEETKLKIGEKSKGRIKTEEAKKKISLSNKGEKNGMFGKTHSDDIRLIISNSAKKMWCDDEIRNKILNDPNKIEYCRKGSLKSAEKFKNLKYTNTKPERDFKEILKNLQINYIQNYSVWNINHKYKADFYIPDFNIIIEIDGKFWHNYPIGLDRDKIREKEMIESGYKVIRFWENEFNIISVKNELNKYDNKK